jgi:hypothetical protein
MEPAAAIRRTLFIDTCNYVIETIAALQYLPTDLESHANARTAASIRYR